MRKRLPAAVLGLALAGDPHWAIAQQSDGAEKATKDHEEIQEPSLRERPQPKVEGRKGRCACGGCAYSPCQSANPPDYCKTKRPAKKDEPPA
jgi:hypothetical protein